MADKRDDSGNEYVVETNSAALKTDLDRLQPIATANDAADSVSISSTATGIQIVAANSARRALIVTNLSSTRTLWLAASAAGAGVVAGKGVPLAPAPATGQPYSVDASFGGMYTGAVSGIMDGADATSGYVAFLEI